MPEIAAQAPHKENDMESPPLWWLRVWLICATFLHPVAVILVWTTSVGNAKQLSFTKAAKDLFPVSPCMYRGQNVGIMMERMHSLFGSLITGRTGRSVPLFA